MIIKILAKTIQLQSTRRRKTWTRYL